MLSTAPFCKDTIPGVARCYGKGNSANLPYHPTELPAHMEVYRPSRLKWTLVDIHQKGSDPHWVSVTPMSPFPGWVTLGRTVSRNPLSQPLEVRWLSVRLLGSGVSRVAQATFSRGGHSWEPCVRTSSVFGAPEARGTCLRRRNEGNLRRRRRTFEWTLRWVFACSLCLSTCRKKKRKQVDDATAIA